MILTGDCPNSLLTIEPKSVAVTEKTVQDALYYYLRNGNSSTIFPNMDTITGYEADILAVTRAGYAYEYEIKLSLADFRADMKWGDTRLQSFGNPFTPAHGSAMISFGGLNWRSFDRSRRAS
jgi:hypothetical protein